jgi:GrpB-like predicted nucleotidyltransferase (UPF0157 family)
MMSEQNKVRAMDVVPHNESWKEEFSRESEKIRNIMMEEILEIYHIGSTAIPGICAKPVIDILVEVKNIEAVEEYNDKMKELGYIARGEAGIEGRRFFLKGLVERTHHVHVFEHGSPEVRRHLNFRDYMILHPEEAKRYDALKKELSVRFRFDPEGYCQGKHALIKELDREAEEWAK